MGDVAKAFVVRGIISCGHNFSSKDIALGENFMKYGEVIGRATKKIHAGTHARIHNIERY
jgi:altronate dehydratase small subunit